MKTNHHKTLLVICWLCAALLACNLGASNDTPVISPRATATPPQPLGYATRSAVEAPPQNVSNDSIDAQIFNLLNEVSSDRLMIHISTLQGFHTRHVNSPFDSSTQGVGAARAYIRNQFDIIQSQSPYNFSVTEQEFAINAYDIATRQFNVIGILTGTEANGDIIVIGAHYDSVSLDLSDPEAFAPGADDNATGVAVLLEMARILSQRPHRATIMFVAFSAEEHGRLGSRAFVNDYLRRYNIPIAAMFNLDTLGSNNDRQGNVENNRMRVYSDGPNTSRSRHLARTANFLAFNLTPGMEIVVHDAIDRENRYGDHFSFSEAEYPAARFIESLESRVNGDPGDTWDTLEAGYLVQTARTILAVVTAMADGPRPPRNAALRDNTNGQRTLVWEPIPDAASYIIALRSPGSLYYNQQFEVPDSSVTWDGFTRSRFEGVAIAAVDASGLVGPLSPEIPVP